MKIATEASAGFASGSAILRNILKRPRPSTRAASSSSPGSVTKNCRMTKVAKTLGAPKIGTRMSGQCVLTMPAFRNI